MLFRSSTSCSQLCYHVSGNLDTKSTQEIMEILKELQRSGRTVIIITHDEEIASQAHRVIRILDGRIEEDYCNR